MKRFIESFFVDGIVNLLLIEIRCLELWEVDISLESYLFDLNESWVDFIYNFSKVIGFVMEFDFVIMINGFFLS